MFIFLKQDCTPSSGHFLFIKIIVDFPYSNPRNQANQDCMASILGLCESHLSVESEAAAHYRNVCRALVSEALELSFFLKKTLVRAEEHSEELQQLALKDWVSFII